MTQETQKAYENVSREELLVRIESLEKALKTAGAQFRRYEVAHREAGKLDKARTNETYAEICEHAVIVPIPYGECGTGCGNCKCEG